MMKFRNGANYLNPLLKNNGESMTLWHKPFLRSLLLSLFIGQSLLATTCASAQSGAYPDRAVRIIVPFAAGATLDLMTRALGQALSTEIKQPVIIENKAGASGIIGAEATIKSEPDGYTFMMAPFSVLAVNPSLHPNLPYDPLKDFVPVSHVADAPHILIASAALPIKTLAQLKNILLTIQAKYPMLRLELAVQRTWQLKS